MRYKRNFLLTTSFIILFCSIGFVVAQTTQIEPQNPQSIATSTISPNNEPNGVTGPSQAGTVEVYSITNSSGSGLGDPNPAIEGSPATNPGPAIAGSGGVGGICRIVAGKEECQAYKSIEIDAGEITAEKIQTQITLPPEVKGKHVPIIDVSVAAAIDKALEDNPEQLFHLIIVVFYGKNGDEAITDQAMIDNATKTLASDFNAVIRETNQEEREIFVDMPANRIDAFPEASSVMEIRFDPAFAMPYAIEQVTVQNAVSNDKIPINEANSINAELTINGNNISIEISKSVNGIVINSNGVSAETTQIIKIDNEGLKLDGKQVLLLPDDAVQQINDGSNAKVKEIGLKVIQDVPVYEIKLVQQAKILWIMPVEMDVKTTVNAQTGAVELVEKPWWSFLVG